MIASFPDRKFQFWEYSVSHGSALIRSPKSASESKNVDLTFVGVEFIQLPRHLDGLELQEATEADAALAASLAGRVVSRVFVLKTGEWRHIIAAAACKIEETDCDIFESPFK